MTVLGDWDVTIKTPIGSLAVEYTFTADGDAVAGAATLKNETVPLQDVVVTTTVAGQRVTWRQSVTKPIRLNLEFDVLIDDDTLTGHSRAGRLPRSAVQGARH